MPRIKINKDKCKSCMLCILACPNGLIVESKKLNNRGVRYVEFSARGGSASGGKDQEKCTGCSMCAIICPDVCIEVYK